MVSKYEINGLFWLRPLQLEQRLQLSIIVLHCHSDMKWKFISASRVAYRLPLSLIPFPFRITCWMKSWFSPAAFQLNRFFRCRIFIFHLSFFIMNSSRSGEPLRRRAKNFALAIRSHPREPAARKQQRNNFQFSFSFPLLISENNTNLFSHFFSGISLHSDMRHLIIIKLPGYRCASQLHLVAFRYVVYANAHQISPRWQLS